jgi:hypothetical protein
MLAPALQKELRTLLIEPIRAGVGNLSWLLEIFFRNATDPSAPAPWT